MDLKTLRSMRKNNSSLSKIASAIEKESTKKSYEDDTMWKLEGDKAGNATAVIRFLPAREDEELPWVKLYSHGFQGPSGRWYIQNCPTTIGRESPVVDHCNELWSTGLQSDQEIAKKRKRKLSYTSNVLIVSDPNHPENEGKVFKFRYGKKIFEKIMDKITPSFEDQKPVDVFDPWEGANFRIRMRRFEGYANFDKSEFDSPSSISEKDEDILVVMEARHPLLPIVAEDQFKSYAELKGMLDKTLAGGILNESAAEMKSSPEVPRKEVKESVPKKSVSMTDDDDMDFFKGLVDDETTGDDVPY